MAADCACGIQAVQRCERCDRAVCVSHVRHSICSWCGDELARSRDHWRQVYDSALERARLRGRELIDWAVGQGSRVPLAVSYTVAHPDYAGRRIEKFAALGEHGVWFLTLDRDDEPNTCWVRSDKGLVLRGEQKHVDGSWAIQVGSRSRLRQVTLSVETSGAPIEYLAQYVAATEADAAEPPNRWFSGSGIRRIHLPAS